MQLTNNFQVACGLDQAWATITDLPKIAPCFPGASLSGSSGEEHRGKVKLDMGSLKLEYEGTARFVSRDASSHRAVLKADGRETKGQGNAAASVTASFAAAGPSATSVTLNTEINITGKAAQMGRGMESEVTAALINQFASNLQSMIASGVGKGGGEKKGGFFRRG